MVQMVVYGPNGARTTANTKPDETGTSEYDRLLAGLEPGREGYKNAAQNFGAPTLLTPDYAGDYGGEDASTPMDQRESVKGVGGTDYDKKDYSNVDAQGYEQPSEGSTSTSSEEPTTAEGETYDPTPLRQLPNASKIVRVGDEFRAVLEFSDGLGAAWYDITSVQYQNLGSPQPTEEYTLDGFTNKYGDFYFGNLNEIEVNGDIAWQEMTKSIFAEYGQYVPLDSPELKRLVMEAYLEGWDGEQTKAAYKNTSYYNNMSNQARAFEGMSTAEQAAEIERNQYKLLAHYIYENGQEPTNGISDLLEEATAVSKGTIGLDGAYYSITTNAQGVEGSSAHRRAQDQIAEKNEALGEADGWYSRIMNAHNTYQGSHIAVEEGHYRELAKQLTTQEKDWNTILGEIQEASGITHVNKDPLLTYNQYSSGAKGIVKGALEIENVGPNDSLVTRILSEELQGKDLDKAIREDSRFLNTTRAKDELTSSVNSLGKALGFEV